MATYALTILQDTDEFDPTILTDHVSFTQSALYAVWQQQLGRKVIRCVITRDSVVVAFMQLIRYPLIKKYTYLYSPYGPVTSDTSDDFFVFLKQSLQPIAQNEHAAFIRLDVTPPTAETALARVFTKSPLVTYHAAYFQPRHEWYLDIRPTEDALFNNMHKKTRYSIQTARKRDVETEIITKEFETHFDDFYRLMTITATRNRFHLHSKEYYKAIFATLPSMGAFLSIARFAGQPLVIEVCIPYGSTVHHVFGCSSNEERTRMPAYAAQWTAITYAKSKGYTEYNFGGIATPAFPNPHWEGLTLFKQRFDGYLVTHSDFFDFVAQPFVYYLYVARKYIQKVLHR